MKVIFLDVDGVLNSQSEIMARREAGLPFLVYHNHGGFNY